MKKLGIFVDHDIIIRHFIRSGVLNRLSDSYVVYYIFPKNVPSRVRTEISRLGLKNTHLISVNLDRISKLRQFCRLTEMQNLRKRSGKDKQAMRLFYKEGLFKAKGQYLVALIKASRLIYPFYARKVKRQLGENSELKQLVEKIGLEVIVHPTVLEGLFINDLIDIGKQRGIPTICLMNSWDNPSTKAMMMGSPDKLLVWGRQTEGHAKKYLGMTSESIVISGAAQMEIYKQEPKMSRSAYREKTRVSDQEKLICYAGSSKGLNEMRHLQVLDRATQESGRSVKIVYRPHPWKAFHEAEKCFFDYGFKSIFLDPFSVKNYEAMQRGESFRTDLMDYESTNVVLRSVDGLIAPVSTILLEAAMFGIPIAVYLSDDGMRNNRHFHTSSRRTQFTEFLKNVKVISCHDIDQLWATIEQLIESSQDSELRKDLIKSTEYFVHRSDKTYTAILFSTIESLIGKYKSNESTLTMHKV